MNACARFIHPSDSRKLGDPTGNRFPAGSAIPGVVRKVTTFCWTTDLRQFDFFEWDCADSVQNLADLVNKESVNIVLFFILSKNHLVKPSLNFSQIGFSNWQNTKNHHQGK